MRIPVSWLRDFVHVPDTPEELARTMSVRGFAVESIESVGDDDAVIDFEVTANRPDCMSVVGMAREIATAYRVAMRYPEIADARSALQPAAATGRDSAHPAAATAAVPAVHLSPVQTVERSDVAITIDDPDLCPRYAGLVADVAVRPSPAWMQTRLEGAGVRPISNIVDVTNYVLLELGHPMHAFDLAKLAGAQIRVRAARPGETLRTLDGHVRELLPEMLVIADAERAAAVAGVMGGADSEVADRTTAIVLESAYFNPLSVRRTSKKLGLKTEASMRFERGADLRMPVTAMQRALALLEAIGAGRARGGVVDCHPRPAQPAVRRLRRIKIEGLLGAAIPDRDVVRILESLGFELHATPDGWDVTVPTRRIDVLREVDLIEEVARHYGFDRLPVTFPALEAAPPALDPRITRARHLRSVLTGAGFYETVTFGFVPHAAAARFASEDVLVPIANPLSENFAVLRPSILPGLLDAVAHNRRREQRDVRLFEVGARFSRTEGERHAIACVWTGRAGADHWSGGARDVDFFDIKGVVDRICEAFRVEAQCEVRNDPWLAAGQAAAVLVNGTRLGVIGRLVPAVAEAHGAPGGDAVYVAELDLDLLERAASGRAVDVQPLPRYPSVTRDISILVDDTLAAADVRRTIHDAAPATLIRVGEFDRYQGKGIPEQKVSLSLRLTFRASDRTLTDAEIQTAMDAVLAALIARHGAIQR